MTRENPLHQWELSTVWWDQTTNFTRYFKTVSPDKPLSLEEFACRPVSVSFVMVNKFGVSQTVKRAALDVGALRVLALLLCVSLLVPCRIIPMAICVL
jgi:hypothetical protein